MSLKCRQKPELTGKKKSNYTEIWKLQKKPLFIPTKKIKDIASMKQE